MAELKKTLPPSVGESQGIGAILDSCDMELDQLEQAARTASQRLAASTADEVGCALWERELGLDVREDLPLEARRTLIRIALEQMDIFMDKFQQLRNYLITENVDEMREMMRISTERRAWFDK